MYKVLVLIFIIAAHGVGVFSTTSKHFGLLHTLQNLTEWAAREEQTVLMLRTRLKLIESETSLIQRYLTDYKESSGQAIRNGRVSANTPLARGEIIGKSAVLGHRMTHRYVDVLQSLRKLLTSVEYTENYLQINDTLKLDNTGIPWVTRDDLLVSMNAFAHIQEINHFLSEEMMYGFDIDTEAGGILHPAHCLDLGVFSISQKRYVTAVEWVEAIDTIVEENAFPDIVSLVTKVLKQEHNRILRTVSFVKNTADWAATKVYLRPLTAYDNPAERMTLPRYDLLYNKKNINEDTVFSLLCMDKTLQSPEITKRLYCFYENKRHPYLYINPVKTEVLLDDPPVLQFYEWIGNKKIEEMKNKSVSQLKIFPHMKKTAQQVIFHRSSVGVRIPENEMPKNVFKFAEMITGLSISGNSENTLYTEYTYGRYYIYHSDASNAESDQRKEFLERTGDRYATMLTYLEVADVGGATPFCHAGVIARPERGSAILWYNLYRNGSYRTDMVHGACPVIHGNKIAMNNWIFYRGNWNQRGCSLNQFD